MASQSQQEDTKNMGQVAPVTKRKRSAATTKRQQRKEESDGGPSVGFASAAGKPAAAYTGWRESNGGPYGRGLAI